MEGSVDIETQSIDMYRRKLISQDRFTLPDFQMNRPTQKNSMEDKCGDYFASLSVPQSRLVDT